MFSCNYLFTKNISKTSGKKSTFSSQHLGVLEFIAFAVEEEIKNSTITFELDMFFHSHRVVILDCMTRTRSLY